MYRSIIYGDVKKCPNRNCRATFYRDSHKGWLPKSELEVYAVMRCPVCRDTFCVVQMIGMVHDYKESLPERALPRQQITVFSHEDQAAFRHELYAIDNPLFGLYDGYYPGAADVPDDNDDYDEEED